MTKEQPNPLQRLVRGILRDAIKSTHKPKPAKAPKVKATTTTKPRPKRLIPWSVRQDVLHRDKKTCQHCGAKAPKVELEVDHIIPVSKGGSNDPTNLQTLCKPCNRGKSNRYST